MSASLIAVCPESPDVATARLLVTTESDSRAATNALLRELRQGQWRPQAWTTFLLAATRRSILQARLRPRALTEITVLHIGFAVVARRKCPLWTFVSWVLAAIHLGLLEDRRSIGVADVLTLTRANLPALTDGWAGSVAALASDLIDGRLARRLGTTSRFGTASDSLADAAFWTWFALRHEPNRGLRVAALAAWAAPVVAVTTASIACGRMVQEPRPVLVRPAAVMQTVLTARALLRRMRVNSPEADSGKSVSYD